MILSVALGSYNGNRFLAAQLASIQAQTRHPDELLVCDDASFDSTRAIVREFARQVPFPVRIETNAANLGSTANFARAIGHCSGDAIVLADQDDFWLPHKLAALEAALRANPRAGFAFSDAEVVDEHLQPLGYTLWNAIRFGHDERQRFRDGRAFEALLRRYRATGATMAFRSAYRDLVLPIPPTWVHDAWIALAISAVAPCAVIDEPLIRYRQHAEQQHGGRRRGLFEQFRAARRTTRATCAAVAARYAAARVRLVGVPDVPRASIELLDAKIEHHLARARLRSTGGRRLATIVQELRRGNYNRFSLGWKAVAQDLLMG